MMGARLPSPRARSRRLLIGLAVSMLCLGSIVPASAGTVDLTVTGIEVTQGIQTAANTILLVAGRAIAVRATIGVSGASSPVTGVTGRLHVFVDGTEITPASGIAAFNAPFTAPLSPQRSNENDTLNFELRKPRLAVGVSSDVDVRVDIEPIPGEADVGNNSGVAADLEAVALPTPTIYFLPVDYTPSGLGLPESALTRRGVGDAFVRGIYPVNDADPTLYRPFPLGLPLTFSNDADGDGNLDPGDASTLLSLLQWLRDFLVRHGQGPDCNTFLFGWVAGNPMVEDDGRLYNGKGLIDGFVGFGNTQPSRFQRTFAHELGHNFGFQHNLRLLDEVGWDVGARLPGNPSGNGVSGRVKPTTRFDIMVGGLLTREAWIDSTTYRFLSLPRICPKFRSGVAVVRGELVPSGEGLAGLDNVVRFPWPTTPSPDDDDGRFAVEVVTDAGETITRRFDGLVGDDSDDEVLTYGSFQVMVPVPSDEEMVSVRVLDGQEVLATVERSEPPAIRVVSPKPGSTLEGTTTIEWDVADSDTPDEGLRFHVAYSSDGGDSWLPVAVDVAGNERQVVVDASHLESSDGNGIIRVFVTDGINTSFADVGDLTS